MAARISRFERYVRGLEPDEKVELLELLMDQATPPTENSIGLVSMYDLFEDAMKLARAGNSMSGLSTGFRNLDEMTLGLCGGELITIFGYTSMGKSQLAQNIALNVALEGHQVLFIGLELTNKQNAARIIKMNAMDPSGAALPFVFPDTPDVSYTDIAQIIRTAQAGGKLGLVVVDQLQDLIHSMSNEQGEIGQIMGELKRAAIEHDVPVIVVSHVNRQGATPGPPPLEVLKGSSSIEQKTDIAISVYRDYEAELGDDMFNRMAVALRKNRQRGMQKSAGHLQIGQGMRLMEERPAPVLVPLFGHNRPGDLS